MHGYKGTANRDFSGGAKLMIDSGYNVILADQRGHMLSEGHQITFGIKEKRDTKSWIDFAYKTFVWNSEASVKANVHCVIIGFSKQPIKPALIFEEDGRILSVSHINAYLVDAPDIFVDSRSKPLCAVPPMIYGNRYDLQYLDISQLSDIPIWFAEYSQAPSFEEPFAMWQYTNSGSVAGIGTPADLNLSFSTAPSTEGESL